MKKNIALHNKKFGISALWRKGCSLLSTFSRFHLTTQHRAADIEHLNFLTDMTSSNSAIDINRLMSLYKPLTSRDVQQDPSWQFAPFLVSTNREKVQISHLQSIQFAHNQRTHIIRWPYKYSNCKGAPEEESERMAAARDPAFFQYFVPNAPAFITTNLNTSLGLANGTQITIRSLIPSSKEQEDFISHHQHVQPYGTVIT